jgi:bacteriocin biosynthesis cyclodehydratase domain-containing protein
MHPLLSPGTHVLRRGPHEVQVGLDPEHAVVLPSSASVLEDQTLPRLVRSGLAVGDDRALRSALPAEDPSADRDTMQVRHTIAALARRTGPALPTTIGSRNSHAVTVTPVGHHLARHLADELVSLCRRCGLDVPSRIRPGPLPRGATRPAPVHVLVGVGEPRRDVVDPWLRDEEPHLLVRFVEGRALVGPFVLPGRTACLRCIDAYLTEEDPAWPLLVEQYARATRTDRPDGIPEPVDAAVAAVAVGWAAREVATYAEGGTPTTLSATIRLGAALETVDTRRWAQHPHCGCSWA